MISYKETKKLYCGKYQYKIILISAGVYLFRTGNLDVIFKNLSKVDVLKAPSLYYRSPIKEQGDLTYLFNVYEELCKMQEFSIRVENPWLSIYTNNYEDIEALTNLDKSRVRCIHRPTTVLTNGEILSTLPFDYKIHFKNLPKVVDYSGFVQWATTSDKVRISKNTINALQSQYIWPNMVYIYVAGEKNLTMAKLYIGSIISRVEKVVQKQA